MRNLALVFMLFLIHCNQDPSQHLKPTSAKDIFRNKMENIKIEEENLRNEQENIRVEYEKRFGKSITDFELSIRGVLFYVLECGRCYTHYLTVTRMTGGALAEYSIRDSILITQLNAREWLNFINALYGLQVDGWEKSYNEEHPCIECGAWGLDIYFFDGRKIQVNGDFTPKGDWHNPPPNWVRLIEIMSNMKARIKDSTVTIKDNAWIAENLNRHKDISWCSADSACAKSKYGRLDKWYIY